MGWMGPDGHEGWVVPLFADGAEATGTESGAGLLVRDAAGAEEWRPDVAVVGWSMGCECGWRGRPWTRVRDAALADAGARLLATTDDFHYLSEADEGLLLEEWRPHIAPWTSVEVVEAAAERLAAVGAELDEAVASARRAGASWADIGRAAGMTRQSANERWSTRV